MIMFSFCTKNTASLSTGVKCFCLIFCLLEVVQLHEYMLEVEISIGDIAVVEQLRDTLENIDFPVRLSSTINITQITLIFTGMNIILAHVICILFSFFLSEFILLS